MWTAGFECFNKSLFAVLNKSLQYRKRQQRKRPFNSLLNSISEPTPSTAKNKTTLPTITKIEHSAKLRLAGISTRPTYFKTINGCGGGWKGKSVSATPQLLAQEARRVESRIAHPPEIWLGELKVFTKYSLALNMSGNLKPETCQIHPPLIVRHCAYNSRPVIK